MKFRPGDVVTWRFKHAKSDGGSVVEQRGIVVRVTAKRVSVDFGDRIAVLSESSLRFEVRRAPGTVK